MKQLHTIVASVLVTALTVALGGCASETHGSGELSVNLIVGDTNVTSVSFEITCDSGVNLSGELNVNDEQDPPVWASVMDLPPGDCTITMTAFDDTGAPLCAGSADFTVVENETVKVNLVLTCQVGGVDPVGNVDIDVTFEVVEGNNCPRVHLLNVVPDEVPEGGSVVTVWVSDGDGDALTTILSATGGSFVDAMAQSTLYTCDDASGGQTVSVTVSDGDTACDHSKSFDVTCPGVNLCDGVTCDDDGNECTDEACNPATGQCETTNNTDPCDGGNGTCNAGVCELNVDCEYAQDFEALDQSSPSALSDDGWLVFGNVFDSGGGFLFGYGPDGAPNGGPAFSAIDVGQGGPTQGAQQLSVYNDYNCCQPSNGHLNGTDLVQSNVFQEINPIPASFVGQTFEFSFDAKPGDIGGSTTALAFIRTLDPNAGFSVTNDITIDTMDLPATWDRYTISIGPIDPGLVGQILQFGFSSTASNFESSGIFYDNIDFCSDDGNGGGDGELTVNGDFETGDISGWTDFSAPNQGTFAATMAQASGGLYSGNLVASVPPQGGFASFPLVRQANIGIGTVAPNRPITISFDLFGSVAGVGGVVLAKFLSELSGGGASSSEILGGGPLLPVAPNDWTAGWVTYTFDATTGPDVSGGVTLQIMADCGAIPGCVVDIFIDNVSVKVP